MGKLGCCVFGIMLGAAGGWIGGVKHMNDGAYVYPTTSRQISDFGDSVSVAGVLKAADEDVLMYPGNSFQAECTRDGCTTFIAVAKTQGKATMLLTTKGFAKVLEFTPQKIIFQEDGGVLSAVIGEHRAFTFTVDRKLRTFRAVGREDEATGDIASSAILELRP